MIQYFVYLKWNKIEQRNNFSKSVIVKKEDSNIIIQRVIL